MRVHHYSTISLGECFCRSFFYSGFHLNVDEIQVTSQPRPVRTHVDRCRDVQTLCSPRVTCNRISIEKSLELFEAFLVSELSNSSSNFMKMIESD